jgi:hypothetical protein
MKKLLIPLLVIAGLAPLAGCVSPYYYGGHGYDYGYGDQRYAPYGDGYNPYYSNTGYGYPGYGYGGYAFGSAGFGYRNGRYSGYYNGYYR